MRRHAVIAAVAAVATVAVITVSIALPGAQQPVAQHSAARSEPAVHNDPAAPRVHVDTATGPIAAGRTVRLGADGDLQRALDQARAGDVIILMQGAVYTGPFHLPRKQGDGWILVRTGANDVDLPAAGGRVDPSFAQRMPKLRASATGVILAEPGAHNYRFVGLEIGPTPGSFLTNVVSLGSGHESAEQLPHHIIFDRCYLHGDPDRGSRRGIALNAADAAVINSWLCDFKEQGADSQAIAGWNGPGPFLIENNYLEAAGENIMFGGADPAISGLVPSDIEIRRNHLAKPLSWRRTGAATASGAWSVKNLLELKNARRVLIEGNLIERNWAGGQNGFAILFTVRNQDGSAPWSVIEDVLFANNIVADAGGGINILGKDDAAASGQARRIAIRNNLFHGIDGAAWGGPGTLFQTLAGTADLTIEQNTSSHTGATIMAEGDPHARFFYRSNLVPRASRGIIGTGTASETPTLQLYFPGALVQDNATFPGDLPDLLAASSGKASGKARGKARGMTRSGADLPEICAAMAAADRPRDLCRRPAQSSPI